ncbi:MAG: type I phosphomannose isomerase catalytic subunit [Planctomycetaceae bacterium]
MVTSPLQFTPLLKRIRWGGRRLGTRLGKPLGPESDYAESWELVDHGADQSRVCSGPWAGRTLNELVREEGTPLLGAQAGLEQFPLLVKFLDANDRLSVQVHPNDQQAAAAIPGERGKTEAWLLLEAEPQACVFAGLKPGIDRAALARAVEKGTVEECLHRLEVKPGDCIFIPAGTVHALGEGVLLAEVQQSSDITYRLHDWNRLGPDGRPRPRHIEASLACTDFARGPVRPQVPQELPPWGPIARERLVAADYFTLDRLRGTGTAPLPAAPHCRIWIVVAGEIRWGTGAGERAGLGSTLLWPANTVPGEVDWKPGSVVIEATWP